MSCDAISSSSAMGPLQIYIMAGQSNMLGMADLKTFPYIGMDPETSPLLDMIYQEPPHENEEQVPSFRECESVWISAIGSNNGDEEERHGKLTVGYGANREKIGPELWFGLTLEHSQPTKQQPILIIKTAWGGKSLHTDFRPPSAGPFEFSSKLLQQLERKGENLDQVKASKKEATGKYYALMMKHIRRALQDIPQVYPEYNATMGYELSGFVWFQGWNDVVDSGFYQERNKPGGYDEYGRLLSLLVQDVRKDLSTPNLPVVIGVIGVHGPQDDNQLHGRFRQAMEMPAQQEELQPIVAVRTESFWDSEIEELDKKWREQVEKKARAIKEEKNLGRDEFRKQIDELAKESFTPVDLKKYKTGKSNAAYHYFGSAKFMARAGQAFAQAVQSLQFCSSVS